jgi:hypothetical protein
MIAFRDDLPLIVLTDRRAIAFDRGWLTRALTVAAHRAGYPNWWLAPHIAESVQSWLKTLHEMSAMPVATFIRAIREALKVIGFAKIADRFEASSPFCRISLIEIAQRAGNGFELAFFETLNRALREVLQTGGSYLELHGLEQCVRVLRQKRTWNRGCDELRREIVAFAREHTARACGRKGRPKKQEIFLHVA